MALTSINPATGETIKSYDEMTAAQVRDIIDASHQAYLGWKTTMYQDRATLVHNAARILRRDSERYARLMAEEMGKPIRDGRAESEKCAWACDFYADKTEEFLRPEPIMTDASKSFVVFRPIGVILSVMPWNFPFWQVFRFAAPALMAGNAAVLKHASNVPGCALAIEEIFRHAGFPENLFRTLLIGSEVVEDVIDHPLIKAATLTGSAPAGRAVARRTGNQLKKTVLELGGSDPYVILEDAELDEVVTTCITSRLINSGQSCIAAKRFVVVGSLYDRFVEQFVRGMEAAKMGDPLDEDTVVGPQARVDLRDDLHRQVRESIEKGARCVLGGEVPQGRGAYYPPTVLTDVTRGMPAYEEELFGPVAAIMSVKDEKEAIRVANDSRYGLGAAIFTRDTARGERIAVDELEAGCCFVNAFVKSDPRLPFGGVKESGFGRELSHYGIKEFVNIKTVYVK